MLRLTLIACIILAGGCAKQVSGFSRPGTTQAVFLQDRFACIKQSQQISARGGNADVIVNRQLFDSCMIARGYRVDPNGPLVPTPGTEVWMQDT